ncbi:MAG TPA: redoxin domain-containing protein [Polyangiaceae bacterium]|nr:redoxin domain-containing protein [Polyangiaceae bacterium]
MPSGSLEGRNERAPGQEEHGEASNEGGGPAWLGVEVSLRAPDEPGVLVRSVVPDSPAERAGILPYDLILTVKGVQLQRPAQLIANISQCTPGERVAITLLRGGRERLLSATLEAQPDAEALLRKRYVESPAPNLVELKSVQGSLEPNLQGLRGKVVVLEFWATWCGPCRLTAPLLSLWSDRHAAEGLAVLGVTADPVAAAAQGAREMGMSYSVFSDETGSTTQAYRAFALPTLFVIDRRGRVRDVMVGYSSARLRQIDDLLGKLLAER